MLPLDVPVPALETLFAVPQLWDVESDDEVELDDELELRLDVLELLDGVDELLELEDVGDDVEVVLVLVLVPDAAVAWWARSAPMPPTATTPAASTPTPSSRERCITGDVFDIFFSWYR
ncbi:hypothetical protein [Calidifontibacter indicus]|uniref:Uncharacterized protein n=1 Tax=Calidifontibacter indicus TaxID=419650 RepID=A0A3D9UKD1_9MICO|nr:hypothetical protein [Calidifontibacter indicus]REF29912.1 hypothetical protein DFJ65_0896 [Calidifontibacter indicus]